MTVQYPPVPDHASRVIREAIDGVVHREPITDLAVDRAEVAARARRADEQVGEVLQHLLNEGILLVSRDDFKQAIGNAVIAGSFDSHVVEDASGAADSADQITQPQVKPGQLWVQRQGTPVLCRVTATGSEKLSFVSSAAPGDSFDVPHEWFVRFYELLKDV